MSPQNPVEKDYYFPILCTIKAYGGSASLDEIRHSIRPFLRANNQYLEEPAGPKTQESRFKKDLNWAGKRLADAGLILKQRTHWELTEIGHLYFLSEKTLTSFTELSGKKAKQKKP
jgi:Mrr N-terminal domain